MAQSPSSDVLAARYADPEMAALFTRERRVHLWRDLWIALAEAQRELGLKIRKEQIDEMRRHRDRINWDVAERKEREIRHDVMAHVHAFAQQCRRAAPIIHLGATSTYVTDNADLILARDALEIILRKLVSVIDRLARFAMREKATPTVAFTHLQAAQPTTVGKRAAIWLQNFVFDLERLEFERSRLRFHGAKGATGTQESFLKLFEGDARKVRALDRLVTKKMGFLGSYPVTGQTYSRKVDTALVTLLAGINESSSKFSMDLRLLQAFHEMEEPREEGQVGSSAMPYKQNPMRAERISSLARYGIHLVGNCFETAATQWFERTLDDSANRRLVLPQAFLICDGVLNLVLNVVSGFRVNYAVIAQNLERELPFLQTEQVLMAAVSEGGDRQAQHERIRKHAQQVRRAIYEQGASNDLLARLRRDPAFSHLPPRVLLRADAQRFVGLSATQVDSFVHEVVLPIRRKYRRYIGTQAHVAV